MNARRVIRTLASGAALLTLGLSGCGGASTAVSGARVGGTALDPLALFEASRPRCVTGPDVAVDVETRDRVHVIAERVRAIGNLPSDTSPETLNASLDQNYRELQALGPAGRAAVRAEVSSEVQASAPNDFLLLDLGHFLMSEDCRELGVALAALERLDPADAIVRMGNTDLFEFTHAMGFRYGPALLPVVDRVVAAADRNVFYPNRVELTPYSQAIFLWGVTDPRVDEHLARLIQRDGPARRLAVEVLSLLSTPGNAQALSTLVHPGGDRDLMVRALRGLINGAGDEGRRVLLPIVPAEFDEATRPLVEQAQRVVSELSYEALRSRLGPAPQMDATALRARLAEAIPNRGVDDELEPGTLLDADIPREEAIDWLRALRAAQLRRLTGGGIEDVQMSSALISVIAYRTH